MNEILAVPEDNLLEVIRVIRAGLRVSKKVSADTRRNLTKWCNDETKYLKECGREDAE